MVFVLQRAVTLSFRRSPALLLRQPTSRAHCRTVKVQRQYIFSPVNCMNHSASRRACLRRLLSMQVAHSWLDQKTPHLTGALSYKRWKCADRSTWRVVRSWRCGQMLPGEFSERLSDSSGMEGRRCAAECSARVRETLRCLACSPSRRWRCMRLSRVWALGGCGSGTDRF